MLKDFKTAAVDPVLRKISTYGNVDYIRLAKAATSYAIAPSDVTRLVKRVREPKVRMIYILDELHSDADALQDVVESQSGDAIMSYVYVKRLRATPKESVQLLTQNPCLAIQYAAFRRYSKFSVDFCPPLKTAAIELIHLANGFAEKPLPLSEVKLKIAASDSKSPWLAPIDWIGQTTAIVKAALEKERKGPVEAPVIPTKSPRALMADALLHDRQTIFDQLSKQYQISKETQEWIMLQTYSKNHKWDKIAEIAKKSTKLAPEVFAEVCFASGRRTEATAFIMRISDAEKKLSIFQAYEYWEDAARIASSMKRPDLAEALQRRSRGSTSDQ
jgi:hypothetical protein